MNTFQCQCGNRLFFHSTRCVNCGAQTGMCPQCHSVTPLSRESEDGIGCNRPQCREARDGATQQLCVNFSQHNVCNRLIAANRSTNPRYCDYCELSTVIPDLEVAGNLEKWRRLERAKHRVLYILDVLRLPFRGNGPPKLEFQFKSDADQPVATGHANGCITINIREADSVHREQSRVEFNEPTRTLIGHFRHELGHYYWDRLVRDQHVGEFRALFGDERDPPYEVALKRYYESGPAAGWPQQFISAYATMHPWEDFAECFSAYLDMATVLHTANDFGAARCSLDDFESTIRNYVNVGVLANEFNRDMGLLDLVPEVFVPPVVEKLRFIAKLRSGSTRQSQSG